MAKVKMEATADPLRARERPAVHRARRSTGRRSMKNDDLMDGAIRDVILDQLTKSRKTYESKVVDESDQAVTSFTSGNGGGFTLEVPPYNLMALAALVDRSNVLRQCIDAYVTNIESTGYSLTYIGPEDGEESPEAVAEAERINGLLDSPNGDYSFTEMRERNRRDMESVGAYAIEVVRDADGVITAFYHTPIAGLYLTRRERDPTAITKWVLRNKTLVEIERNIRFRRIVQKIGTIQTFFKEFGDPRNINPKTGKVDDTLTPEEVATEILYVPLYKSGYIYGVPRYIHQLVSIMGSRESELTNLQYFKDNAIPAMAVLLSGGTLTTESYDDLDEFMNRVRGREAQNKILTIEALADANSASEKGALQPPKLDLKPLGNERQQDALFQEYDKANQTKVRSAFRLNPIFVGLSEDMTYASAKASLEMSEAQVFGPERNKVDEVINSKLLLNGEGQPPVYWWVKSNQPRLVDPTEIKDSLAALEASGSITPNIGITIMNEMFGTEIAAIEEPWGDLPFSVTSQLVQSGKEIVGFEKLFKDGVFPDPPPVVDPFAAPADPNGDPPAPASGDPPPAAKQESARKRRTYGNAVRGAR